MVSRVVAPGQPLAPVDLTGHRVVFTVRQFLVDGTVDSVSPPVWQGDNEGIGGVTLAAQSGTTLGWVYAVMPASATQALPNPTGQPTRLYYDVLDVDGTGNEFQTEFGNLSMTPRAGLSQG
jgi:hypothetical protein